MFTMDGKESMALKLLSILDVKNDLQHKAAKLLTFSTRLNRDEKKLHSGELVGSVKDKLAT